MNNNTDSNFVMVDAIASEAFVMTMITCLLCERDLMAADLDLEEPNNPMEEWAKNFCYAAKNIGWSITSTGSIVCPKCNEEISNT